jgi:crotonobetainyl-CoA:carnitine CoA-transferase CaiB-like acyl-CoA transferase
MRNRIAQKLDAIPATPCHIARMTNPLTKLRVIELGTMIAAPFATHIFAQLGAEVIKVEPPTGDTTRALVRGGPSGTFIAYNHSKKSVAIALDTAEGLAAFYRLVASADIVLHNLSPAATRKLKIGADDLAAINPSLIYCHIKGYGPGPQANDLATNPVAEAATGVMDDHRINGRPTRLGPSYHDQFAGSYAVIRIMAALMNPAPTAADRVIEIGLYETGLHLAARDLAGVQLKTHLLGRPEREAGGEFAMPGYGAYETSDGRWIYLLVLTDAHWAKLCQALDMPERADAALAKLRERKKQRDRVEAAVRDAVAAVSIDEASARLRAAGVGFNEVMPLERVLEVEQARQPGTLRDLAYRGLRFEVPEMPGQNRVVDNLSPPELGAHSVEVLAALGYSAAQSAALIASGAVVGTMPEKFAWAPVRKS